MACDSWLVVGCSNLAPSCRLGSVSLCWSGASPSSAPAGRISPSSIGLSSALSHYVTGLDGFPSALAYHGHGNAKALEHTSFRKLISFNRAALCVRLWRHRLDEPSSCARGSPLTRPA